MSSKTKKEADLAEADKFGDTIRDMAMNLHGFMTLCYGLDEEDRMHAFDAVAGWVNERFDDHRITIMVADDE